jgi:hypothetical protein
MTVKMPSIFRNYPNPSLFAHTHFRTSYSLLQPIRNLIENIEGDLLNVVSIACGTALELSTFELLTRSRGITVNYIGCDIDKSDLRFNARVLQRRSPGVKQSYIHSDIATHPPVNAIANANCIIWRHPEFLSDHEEIPKTLILDMGRILWNILATKNEAAPILITTYDPHEMMVVLELMNQFCEDDLAYDLKIDMQNGRASWQNPIIDPEDLEPLFNTNHHDHCQLLVTHCRLKDVLITPELFFKAISSTFQNILINIQPDNQELPICLKEITNPDIELFRAITTYLNDQIRDHATPFIKRDELCSLLIDLYQQNSDIRLTETPSIRL